MNNSAKKNIPAWHSFLNYAVILDGTISPAEAIKLGYAKDKKAFYNIIYTLEKVKKFITYVKLFDHESKTWIYEIFLTDAGEKFIKNCDQIKHIEHNRQPSSFDNEEDDNIVITYKGNVVHSFKKCDIVKFLNVLDDVLTDFAIAGI